MDSDLLLECVWGREPLDLRVGGYEVRVGGYEVRVGIAAERNELQLVWGDAGLHVGVLVELGDSDERVAAGSIVAEELGVLGGYLEVAAELLGERFDVD